GEGENTSAGVLKGKVAYLPPEAAAGQPIDGRGDVFSLGVVLYELLTGMLPFKRDRDAATLYAILTAAPPNPRELNPQIQAPLAAVLHKALEKAPEQR